MVIGAKMMLGLCSTGAGGGASGGGGGGSSIAPDTGSFSRGQGLASGPHGGSPRHGQSGSSFEGGGIGSPWARATVATASVVASAPAYARKRFIVRMDIGPPQLASASLCPTSASGAPACVRCTRGRADQRGAI